MSTTTTSFCFSKSLLRAATAGYHGLKVHGWFSVERTYFATTVIYEFAYLAIHLIFMSPIFGYSRGSPGYLGTFTYKSLP